MCTYTWEAKSNHKALYAYMQCPCLALNAMQLSPVVHTWAYALLFVALAVIIRSCVSHCVTVELTYVAIHHLAYVLIAATSLPSIARHLGTWQVRTFAWILSCCVCQLQIRCAVCYQMNTQSTGPALAHT